MLMPDSSCEKSWSASNARMSIMSLWFVSTICSFISSRSASDSVCGWMSSRSRRSIVWHIWTLSTNTSSCRLLTGSQKNSRLCPWIALNAGSGW